MSLVEFGTREPHRSDTGNVVFPRKHGKGRMHKPYRVEAYRPQEWDEGETLVTHKKSTARFVRGLHSLAIRYIGRGSFQILDIQRKKIYTYTYPTNKNQNTYRRIAKVYLGIDAHDLAKGETENGLAKGETGREESLQDLKEPPMPQSGEKALSNVTHLSDIDDYVSQFRDDEEGSLYDPDEVDSFHSVNLPSDSSSLPPLFENLRL